MEELSILYFQHNALLYDPVSDQPRFVGALELADRVIVTDVFTRRESNINKPTGKDLALAIGGPKATYVGGELTNVANFISRNAKKDDLILVMGAGDVYKVSDLLLAK